MGLHILGRFFWGGNLSMCKLQCELVATAALFAHIHVVRGKILSFFFDYGVKLCRQAASTAHSLHYLQGVCVPASRKSCFSGD